jgi:hypothetical protein
LDFLKPERSHRQFHPEIYHPAGCYVVSGNSC